MRQHWLREAEASWTRWKQAYETRTDPEAIRAHYAQLREKFVAALGGFPERTPLNPRVTGTIARDGFRVDKIIFESRPQFFVTASLYLPDPAKYPAPRPGILIPSGHYQPAKAHDEYQSMGALLALQGMAALVFDPIEQGERLQNLDATGRARYWGTNAHTLDDIQAIPLGQSIARQFIWDGMRAIDYLQSRPEIDPTRIGCTGHSGGGTQTSYLLALDDRIKAAAVSCYISHLSSQVHVSLGDGEQNLFAALAFGLDHPDFLLMRAPTPVLLLAATHDFFDINATWETFRLAQRAYTRLGAPERMAIAENDASHSFNRTQREAAARWFARWLLGEEREIHEPTLNLFTETELRCTPSGQVMLLPGARSIRDLFRADADRASATRSTAWARLNGTERRAAVRRIASFRALAELPDSRWTRGPRHQEPGYRTEQWQVQAADQTVTMPALWLEPSQPVAGPVLVFLTSEGLEAEAGQNGRLATLARAGRRVLALDVRGTGATRQRNQQGMTGAVGRDYWDIYSAYLLGRTYVGLQAEDVLIAAREAARRGGGSPVDLIALGGVGVPALHAVFSDSEIFHGVTLDGMVSSWDHVVRADKSYGQFMNVVHGALQTYDLPDLVASLGSGVTLRNPAEPNGIALNAALAAPEDHLPSRPGLTGVQFGSPGFLNPQAVSPLMGGTSTWGGEFGRDWSARWTGFLVPAVTGNIVITLETNEEATVRLADKIVATAPGSLGAPATPVALSAGEAKPLVIEFIRPRRDADDKNHVSRLQILWLGTDSIRHQVPDSWLRHSRVQENAAESSLR